jgi:hypothetical protein
MRRISRILLAITVIAGSVLACGRNGDAQSAGGGGAGSPPATYTTVPTPLPLVSTPAQLPASSELQALIAYANAMAPLISDAGILLERDGAILEASQDGNDDVLCDGRLAADNGVMKGIVANIRAIQSPAKSERIHELVIKSGDAWTEALDEVENFCSTGNALYKVSAAAKFWQAALTFQDAGNRFWMLVMSQGIDAWVQR